MMTGNGWSPAFRKSAKLRVTNEFPSKDVPEILAYVLAQKSPGELVISIPGNGGISGIVFREKETTIKVETPVEEIS